MTNLIPVTLQLGYSTNQNIGSADFIQVLNFIKTNETLKALYLQYNEAIKEDKQALDMAYLTNDETLIKEKKVLLKDKKEIYKDLKNRYSLFSAGLFNTISKKGNYKLSGLCFIDIDDTYGISKEQIIDLILNDNILSKWLVTYWSSISGGLALIFAYPVNRLENLSHNPSIEIYNDWIYKEVFNYYETLINNLFNIQFPSHTTRSIVDVSTKDVSRRKFLTWDANIWTNPSIIESVDQMTYTIADNNLFQIENLFNEDNELVTKVKDSLLLGKHSYDHSKTALSNTSTKTFSNIELDIWEADLNPLTWEEVCKANNLLISKIQTITCSEDTTLSLDYGHIIQLAGLFNSWGITGTLAIKWIDEVSPYKSFFNKYNNPNERKAQFLKVYQDYKNQFAKLRLFRKRKPVTQTVLEESIDLTQIDNCILWNEEWTLNPNQYLSDINLNLTSNKIWIQSGTGTGKTYSFITKGISLLNKIVFLVPKISIADGIYNDPKYKEVTKCLLHSKADTISNWDIINSQLIVSTWDQMSRITNLLQKEMIWNGSEEVLNPYPIKDWTLVIDEAHEIVQSASYRPAKIDKIFNQYSLYNKLICLTGTTIMNESFSFYQNFYKIKVIKDQGYKPYKIVKKECQWNDIISLLVPNNLNIIFINDRAEQELLKTYLEDITQNGIKSFNTGIFNSDNSESPLWNTIIKDSYIPNDIEVLLTTSIFESGINIYNTNCKTLQIVNKGNNWIGPESIQQIYNRFRNNFPEMMYIHLNPKVNPQIHFNEKEETDLLLTEANNLLEVYNSNISKEISGIVLASRKMTSFKFEASNKALINWVTNLHNRSSLIETNFDDLKEESIIQINKLRYKINNLAIINKVYNKRISALYYNTPLLINSLSNDWGFTYDGWITNEITKEELENILTKKEEILSISSDKLMARKEHLYNLFLSNQAITKGTTRGTKWLRIGQEELKGWDYMFYNLLNNLSEYYSKPEVVAYVKSVNPSDKRDCQKIYEQLSIEIIKKTLDKDYFIKDIQNNFWNKEKWGINIEEKVQPIEWFNTIKIQLALFNEGETLSKPEMIQRFKNIIPQSPLLSVYVNDDKKIWDKIKSLISLTNQGRTTINGKHAQLFQVISLTPFMIGNTKMTWK